MFKVKISRKTIDCLRHWLMKNLFGIVVTSGLGEYKNKILRLGHMGNFNQRDALILLSSFEAVLHILGFNDDIGRGLKVLCDHLKD